MGFELADAFQIARHNQ